MQRASRLVGHLSPPPTSSSASASASVLSSGSEAEPEVLVRRVGHVCSVKLNRPKALNALNTSMIAAIRCEKMQTAFSFYTTVAVSVIVIIILRVCA